jgi:hypothetical protein
MNLFYDWFLHTETETVHLDMKRLLSLAFVLLFVTVTHAQNAVPYNWSYSAKKVSENVYELHFHVDLNGPWHTYSQFTPDGGPVPTKFTFTKNPLYTLDGTVKENGSLIQKHEAVFGVDVKYFNSKVDFVQLVKLKTNAKTNFTGSVEFMVCNDQQCLPPATQKFSIALN